MPRPSTKELNRLLSDLGKLSAPLGRPAIQRSMERLRATDPSSRPLAEALECLETAHRAFPSNTLLARGLAIAARVPASDVDLLARIAATAEPMLATVARTRPRAFEKSPSLLVAISGSVLVSAALDRVGNAESLEFVRRMVSNLDRVGAHVVGFGVDLPSAGVFIDSRGVALRVLLDASVAILSGRALDPGEDSGDDPDHNGGEPPLDDRLQPPPWGYARAVSERVVADLVETVVDADGDCMKRARANLAVWALSRDFIDRSKAAETFDQLISSANPDVRQELAALRDVTLGGPPAASPLPQLRSSAKPTSARRRCKACECEACPMAGRRRR